MPVVSKQEQRWPAFTEDVVTAILAATRNEKYFLLFVLCAAAGLRFGEALGINIKTRHLAVAKTPAGFEINDIAAVVSTSVLV